MVTRTCNRTSADRKDPLELSSFRMIVAPAVYHPLAGSHIEGGHIVLPHAAGSNKVFSRRPVRKCKPNEETFLVLSNEISAVLLCPDHWTKYGGLDSAARF